MQTSELGRASTLDWRPCLRVGDRPRPPLKLWILRNERREHVALLVHECPQQKAEPRLHELAWRVRRVADTERAHALLELAGARDAEGASHRAAG